MHQQIERHLYVGPPCTIITPSILVTVLEVQEYHSYQAKRFKIFWEVGVTRKNKHFFFKLARKKH